MKSYTVIGHATDQDDEHFLVSVEDDEGVKEAIETAALGAGIPMEQFWCEWVFEGHHTPVGGDGAWYLDAKPDPTPAGKP